MVQRPAWIAIHPANVAMLVLVVSDDCTKVIPGRLDPKRLDYERAQDVKELTLVEPELAITARLSDPLIQSVENDSFLGQTFRAG
jgi:hypothetical protein